jgi:hypothetical protein
MAKRFTDTEKWKDEWWGSLSNDYRMIWLYLVDSCSIAGIWKKDFRGLNFNCNTNINEAEFLNVFSSRLVDRGNFFFIPKFLLFQYPKGLNSDKPAIVSVRKEIESNNLDLIIKQSLPNGFLTIKDKDKDKDNGQGQKPRHGQIEPAESFSDDWQRWGKLIVDGSDQYWEQMKGRKVSQQEMDAFLSVATRNDWTMDTAQKFRTSLKGFDFKNNTTNGTIRPTKAITQSTQPFSGDYTGNGGPVLRGDIDL